MGGVAMFIMLFGGSRSGKTFIIIRAIVIRALAAAGSRHVILRFRFNHVKASVVRDTFPKVMTLCFPGVEYHLDKTDWFVKFPNGSEIWFGGLDDKERTEKILGQEHATIYLNESSQIPYSSVQLAITRLAQVCTYEVDGETKPLRNKMFFDCNPPSMAHWSYKQFVKGLDPESGRPLINPEDYAALQMNPKDNAENLADTYLKLLQNMPTRMKARFWEGKFGDTTENALWTIETVDKYRTEEVPDMQRIVVAVDPSGAGNEDNLANDEIGIVVCGLGVDGNGYLLEDITVKAGPAVWGNIATTAFDRHAADLIVGEINYGGEMVKFVVRAAKPGVPFKKITASRGKVVRAEPIASLTEQGKIRFAGNFALLEDELYSFTTLGYIGENSPNRVDAFVWGMSELFPGMVKEETRKKERTPRKTYSGAGAWMA
jgi:phage terminase large subunit-like protein